VNKCECCGSRDGLQLDRFGTWLCAYCNLCDVCLDAKPNGELEIDRDGRLKCAADLSLT